MKELDDFTVERLQAIAEPNTLVFPPSHDEAAALARIALAAKTAELVAFRVGDRLFSSLYSAGCYASEMKLKIEPLYLEAIPNSPELPDGWIKCSERMPPYETNVVMWDSRDSGPVIFNTYSEDSYTRGLRLYLAAMGLTHWKPVSPPTTEK